MHLDRAIYRKGLEGYGSNVAKWDWLRWGILFGVEGRSPFWMTLYEVININNDSGHEEPYLVYTQTIIFSIFKRHNVSNLPLSTFLVARIFISNKFHSPSRC